MEPPVYSIPPLEFAPAVPKPQEESSAEASKEGGGGGDVGSATASVVDVQQRQETAGSRASVARLPPLETSTPPPSNSAIPPSLEASPLPAAPDRDSRLESLIASSRRASDAVQVPLPKQRKHLPGAVARRRLNAKSAPTSNEFPVSAVLIVEKKERGGRNRRKLAEKKNFYPVGGSNTAVTGEVDVPLIVPTPFSEPIQKRHEEEIKNILEKRKVELQKSMRLEEKAQKMREKLKKTVLTSMQKIKSGVEVGNQMKGGDESDGSDKKEGQGQSEGKKQGRDVSTMVARLAAPLRPAPPSTLLQQQQEIDERRKAIGTPRHRSTYQPRELEWQKFERKHGVNRDVTKVFVVDPTYQVVKQALLRRGWVENPDPLSPAYHLRWSNKCKDVDFSNMGKEQKLNHFPRNSEITTKVGLKRNLENLHWHESVNIDTFFPRCYDLQDPEEMEMFLSDYKLLAAIIVLTKGKSSPYFGQSRGGDVPSGNAEFEQWKWRMMLALLVVERAIKAMKGDLDDVYSPAPSVLDMSEWSLILGEKYPDIAPTRVPLRSEHLPCQKLPSSVGKALEAERRGVLRLSPSDIMTRVDEVLMQVPNVARQHAINGVSNAWIVKPAGKSRGRGIQCFASLGRIVDYTSVQSDHWLVQKYIETPLLGEPFRDGQMRKFDIRQWVLVTDWNPLTVFFYDENYFRFSTEPFDMSDMEDVYRHLTNNSILKEKDDIQSGGINVDDTMWSTDQFCQYLRRVRGTDDDYWTKHRPRMEAVTALALKSAKDVLPNQKESFEVFGFDFMIDETDGVWLIEINSSPAMAFSTSTTTRMCQNVLEDTIKVVVDLDEDMKKWRDVVNDADAFDAAKQEFHTRSGQWRLLYRDKAKVLTGGSPFCPSLACEGRQIVNSHTSTTTTLAQPGRMAVEGSREGSASRGEASSKRDVSTSSIPLPPSLKPAMAQFFQREKKAKTKKEKGGAGKGKKGEGGKDKNEEKVKSWQKLAVWIEEEDIVWSNTTARPSPHANPIHAVECIVPLSS